MTATTTTHDWSIIQGDFTSRGWGWTDLTLHASCSCGWAADSVGVTPRNRELARRLIAAHLGIFVDGDLSYSQALPGSPRFDNRTGETVWVEVQI